MTNLGHSSSCWDPVSFDAYTQALAIKTLGLIDIIEDML